VRSGMTVAITLREGTFYLDQTIVLTEIDSFLTVQRYKNELVIISGGELIEAQQWRQFSNDPNQYWMFLPVEETFKTLFVGDRRSIRARAPDGNPETSGTSAWFGGAQSWAPPVRHDAALEVHVQSPSRDGTYFPTYEVGIGGAADSFDPAVSYWALKRPAGGGASTYRVPSGLTTQPGQIPAPSNLSASFVHAMHCGYWGSWIFSVANASANGSSVDITFDRGGWQEARGCDQGAIWFFDNSFEVWDSPNEWYDQVARAV
jgi:hypothetical protein